VITLPVHHLSFWDQSIISRHLDYCNSLLFGISDWLLRCLQSVQRLIWVYRRYINKFIYLSVCLCLSVCLSIYRNKFLIQKVRTLDVTREWGNLTAEVLRFGTRCPGISKFHLPLERLSTKIMNNTYHLGLPAFDFCISWCRPRSGFFMTTADLGALKLRNGPRFSTAAKCILCT